MTADYYRERAADARRQAEESDLANVRERCLRSEQTFLDMADRADRGAKMRARLEAERAAAQPVREAPPTP